MLETPKASPINKLIFSKNGIRYNNGQSAGNQIVLAAIVIQ